MLSIFAQDVKNPTILNKYEKLRQLRVGIVRFVIFDYAWNQKLNLDLDARKKKRPGWTLNLVDRRSFRQRILPWPARLPTLLLGLYGEHDRGSNREYGYSTGYAFLSF